MAIKLNTSFVRTSVPGSYFQKIVKSTPLGTATDGVILLIGEATAGPTIKGIDSTDGQSLKELAFGPDQMDQVSAIFESGPIVDAFKALTSPSADTGITGAPNLIYIAKTNKGAKASALVDTSYGTIKSKNWGESGNKYNFLISATQSETVPQYTSATVPAFGAALDNANFKVRVDGGSEVTIILGSGAGVHDNITELVSELNSLFTAAFVDLEATEVAGSDTFILAHKADVQQHTRGWSKSYELVEITPGDLAKLGLSEMLVVSSAEQAVQVDIKRPDIGFSESFDVEAVVAFKIGYQGTSATLTITGSTLTTTVSGGSGANLIIDLTQYTTLEDLAEYISSQTGYTAEAVVTEKSKSPLSLDKVSAIGIAATGASLTPGRIKRATDVFVKALENSTAIELDLTATEGLPDDMATAKYLSGGTKGFTTGADIVKALSDAEGIDAQFIIPLFSRDASDDITDGLTDSSSSYTIDAIHASARSHVIAMSQPKVKKHRIAMLSYWGTYSDAKQKAATVSHHRVSMAYQRVSQVDSTGNITMFQPWLGAVVAAGMQAAGFYKSITNKFANLVGLEDPAGFDNGVFSDLEDAIESGLLPLKVTPSGIQWVVSQTTYNRDSNFVYNDIQAVYASDLVALGLTGSLQSQFVGQSLADVDAPTMVAFIEKQMDLFRSLKLIAPSDDAPAGYKNIKVKIDGPIANVSLEIKLATTLLFVPVTLEISQVSSQA